MDSIASVPKQSRRITRKGNVVFKNDYSASCEIVSSVGTVRGIAQRWGTAIGGVSISPYLSATNLSRIDDVLFIYLIHKEKIWEVNECCERNNHEMRIRR